MDRDCNKCVYLRYNCCQRWECDGVMTIEDVKRQGADERAHELMLAFNALYGDQHKWSDVLSKAEALKARRRK